METKNQTKEINILFLITARGGSKGVPEKNVRELGGISLIGYKAISALKSKYCTRLILSTDSDSIAECALKYQVEVPFMRPDFLATDEATSMDAIIHAMTWIEENDPIRYDALALLEPSSPFATYEDINQAVELFLEKNADCVLGVREAEVSTALIGEIGDDLNMSLMYHKEKALEKTRRQDMKTEYTMNGAIYLADWNYLKTNRFFGSPDQCYAYIMPRERSVEIDSMLDFHIAEMIVEKKLIDLSMWTD